jgi:hypothetical protein
MRNLIRQCPQAFCRAPAILPGMRLFRRPALALVLLLCGTLLLTRIGGDHLHLCLDGQEPAVVLHGEDGGLHHIGVEAGQPHNDRDIDLQSASTLKSQPRDLVSAQFLFSPVFELLASNIQARWAPAPSFVHLPSPFRHLRPPLRGPPR